MKKKSFKFMKIIYSELKRMISKKPGLCIGIILIGIIESILLLEQTIILQKFLENVTFATENPNKVHRTIISFVFLCIIIISLDILNAISNYMLDKQKMIITKEIMGDLFLKLKDISVLYLEDPNFLNIINKASIGVEKSISLFIKIEIVISNFIIYFTMLFIYFFKLHPLLSAIILCVFIPTLISYRYRNKINSITEEKVAIERRKMNTYESYISNRKYFKETHHLKATNFFITKLLKSIYRFNKLNLKAFNKINIIKLILNFINFIGFILILGILYYLTIIKAISIGEIGAVIIAVTIIYERMNELFNIQLADISELYNGMYNLHYILEYEVDLKNEVIKGQNLDINFRDVSFKYPNSNKNTLRNISLDIKANEVVAIVGENGSGKTTLAKLIAGIYSPSDGDIFYNGISIDDIKLSSLYEKITIVFQDFKKYALSVCENISISDIYNVNSIRVNKCLNLVGLTKIVENLKEGVDTLLSKEFGGTDLSLGQWQRIAIARANYKEASIIIFDEPTASLDPLQEMDIIEKFMNVTKDKTTIIVTHRIGAAKLADKVITMKDGQVVEIGSHEELIKKQGTYSNLYKKQQQWYK